MCKVLKGLFAEVIMRVQSWSIKKQMMLCYLMGILAIVTMVIGVVVLNTFLLQQGTVDKVEQTRNTQANKDLYDLSLTGSQVIYSKVYGALLSQLMLKNMLIEMFRESTFAVDYTTLYTSIPASLITQNTTQYYGDHTISLEIPTIQYLKSDYDATLSKMISRFSYVLPTLLRIYEGSSLRYTLYFEAAGLAYFYPGIELTAPYSPSSYPWYSAYQSTLDLTYSNSYPDTLGNETNSIVSIIIPLFDSINSTTPIGFLCGDYLVDSLYKLLTNLLYLGKGESYIIYKDGSIIDVQQHSWINPMITSLADLDYTDFWPGIQSSPNGIHYLIEAGDIWRASTTIVSNNPETAKDWDFLLLILVKESDVMLYKESAKSKIKDEGVKFIIITIVCSVVASLVIICFIHYQAKKISRPIQGIIDFTYKLNTEGNSAEVLKEIDDLEEGTDQIERLVLAYKSLAKSLINRKKSDGKLEDEQAVVYPPNELQRIDRSLLDKNIDHIPRNISMKSYQDKIKKGN